jgi:hypothetical protein
VFKEIVTMKTQTIARIIALAALFALQACSGGSEPNTEPATGTGGAVTATGGDTGTGGQMTTGGAPGTGGQMLATGGAPGMGGTMAATGGTPGTGGQASTGGQPGTGGQPATGGAVGTGGSPATGGSPGTGGAPAVGPWGPMPRMTCDIFNLTFANGTATVTAASSSDPSCSDAAALFVSKRSSQPICMGAPVNFGATLVTWSVASPESDAQGNCDVTLVVDNVQWTNGCVLTVTMDLLAQAPPKATVDQPGPFPPPSCN